MRCVSRKKCVSDPVFRCKPHADPEERRPSQIGQRHVVGQQPVRNFLQVGERRKNLLCLQAVRGGQFRSLPALAWRNHRYAVVTGFG